jgi:Glycosyltransferase family 87
MQVDPNCSGRATRLLVLFALLSSPFVLLTIGFWPTNMPLDNRGLPAFIDLSNQWMAIKAAHSGEYANLFYAERHRAELVRTLGAANEGQLWSYPPTAILFVLPLGVLPTYGWFAAVWAMLGALAVWAMFSARQNRIAPPIRQRLRVLLSVAAAPGTLLCLLVGQTALFTSASLFFGLLYARTRPTLAAAVLALLVAKPHLGLAVPAALIGLAAPVVFVRTALFALLYVGISAAALGFEPWILFLKVTLPQQTHALARFVALIPDMAGVTAYQQPDALNGVTALVKEPMKMTLAQLMGAAGFGSAAMAVHWSMALVVMVALVVGLRQEDNFSVQFVLVALATLIVSPYLLGYEMTLLTLAVGLAVIDPEATARIGQAGLTGLIAVVTVGHALAVASATLFDTLNLTPLLLPAAFAWLFLPYLKVAWTTGDWFQRKRQAAVPSA